MLHAAGLKVFPWTINTRAEAEKLLALGVDGLICNELRVMRADLKHGSCGCQGLIGR